jgi:hypothetical protein
MRLYSAVGDDGDRVGTVGQVIRLGFIFGDGHAHRSDAGRVGDGQVVKRFHLQLGGDAYLSPGCPVLNDGFLSVIPCLTNHLRFSTDF